jgi:hypothetical protein
MVNYLNQKYPDSNFILAEMKYDLIGGLTGYNGGLFIGIVTSQGSNPIRFAIYYQHDKSLTDTYSNSNPLLIYFPDGRAAPYGFGSTIFT